MDSLTKTIIEMPKVFTSYEFNRAAIKNGYSERSLKNKGLSSFISKYADNGYRFSKTWTKKSNIGLFENPTIKKEKEQMSELEMIEFLKSKGYRIMKRVSEWQEC
jgi:hypothetical protein